MEAVTSNPALFANAALMKGLLGRRVRTVLKIVQADGGTIQGQSPDGMTITVRQVVKNEEFSPFVEVVGVVEGELSLRCEKCTNFGDKFDMSNFNSLCQLANSQHSEIFI
ncbi:unnamed protein product [Calypogeia fissa]